VSATCNHHDTELVWYGIRVQLRCKHCHSVLTYCHETGELLSVTKQEKAP
jgi:hypothetical protein